MSILDVSTLRDLLEGLTGALPPFAPVEIAEREDDGPLRVMLCRAPTEAAVDTVVITNDPNYLGVQLWPTS